RAAASSQPIQRQAHRMDVHQAADNRSGSPRVAICRTSGRARFLALLSLAGACASPDSQEAGLAPPTTGTLTVVVQGLPEGTPAAVIVSSPLGNQFTLTGPEKLTA